MATLGTNLNTGLSFRFLVFGSMDKTVGTVYRNVFGGPGKLYSITINNSQGSAAHGLIKLFDTTAALTVAASEYAVSPSAVIPFTKQDTSGTTIANRTAFTTILFPDGLQFTNGLGVAIAPDAATDFGIKAANSLGDDVTSVVLAYK